MEFSRSSSGDMLWQWRAWKQQLATKLASSSSTQDICQLLMWSVSHLPGRLGKFSWAQLTTTFVKDTSEFPPDSRARGNVRDCLPLPLHLIHKMPVGGHILSPDELARVLRAESGSGLSACKASVLAAMMGLGLNYWYTGHLRSDQWHAPMEATSLQLRCMVRLSKRSQRFWEASEEVALQTDWAESLKKVRVDYDGDETCLALPLKWCEIEPSLPLPGIAASINATDLASDAVRSFLENPLNSVLPEEEWPERVPRAKVFSCNPTELQKCLLGMHKRGILAAISKEEVFHTRGEPVLNGLFGVTKKGTPPPGVKQICRVILNMIPANAYLRVLNESLGTLSASTSWCSIWMNDEDTLLWSGDDQKGAFYVYKLPKPWLAFTAINATVPGHQVGRPDLENAYLAFQVIPMGFGSAVAVFQHLHRRLGFLGPPRGAGHQPRMEWRRDAILPLIPESLHQEWVQYYLDDFDNVEIMPSCEASALVGNMSNTHSKQRAAYEFWGVGIAEEKSHQRCTLVERMGAAVDGEQGLVSVPPQKIWQLVGLVLHLVSKPVVHWKQMLVVLGRLSRAFEYRRALMSILNKAWLEASKQRVGPLTAASTQELLHACLVLPLAVTNLKARIDGLITCSDASTTGGGCCASSGVRSPELLYKSLQSCT
eukprot:6464112-Amphidinium_carterae.2